MKKITTMLLMFLGVIFTTFSAEFVKELEYDKYTLQDTYKYEKGTRGFQWDKISSKVDEIENFVNSANSLGIARNYKNVNGKPTLSKIYSIDSYKVVRDEYGRRQDQSIPMYVASDLSTPERYMKDGTLVSILGKDPTNKWVSLKAVGYSGEYWVPVRYIKSIDTKSFTRIAAVDRANQNLATLEKVDGVWKIRSMVPVSTGADHPPHGLPTPLGTFVVQDKQVSMRYLKDGTTDVFEGFAPYASRFSGGGYLHGVPVNLPRTEIIEYSETLGTTPRSHMCVRNISSHAKWLFTWLPVNNSIVIVFE
jgi:hypothetical protein